MGQTVSSPAAEATIPAAAGRRKITPLRAGLLFVVLLMLALTVTHFVTYTGPQIKWIENDLDKALAQAAQNKQRVFLYLYEPDDPVAARNEREVFSQRWARETLAKMACCRVALQPADLLADKYAYKGTPLFLVLDQKGGVLGRTEGAVDEPQFYTHVEQPSRPLRRR